jgi:hypothetical protein
MLVNSGKSKARPPVNDDKRNRDICTVVWVRKGVDVVGMGLFGPGGHYGLAIVLDEAME